MFGGKKFTDTVKARVGNGLLPEGSSGALRRVPYEIDHLKTLSVVAVERATGKPVDRSKMRGDGAWIDYAGPPGHLRYVSFSKAVKRTYKPGTFRNKIVVIGAVAPSLQDRHPTSWPAGEMAGPEIHANAIDTLLRDFPLHASSETTDLLIALALTLLPILLGIWLRPFVALGIGLAVAVLYAVLAQVAFGRGLILPVVVPLTGLAVALAGTLVVHYLTASVERAQTRDLFSRFVPDSVVAQVLERADTEDDVRLGGELLTATVLFSDLRGFTSFAEGREPAEVIGVLNRYLTEMSDAILDHDGTLVAYMGDGIMAVFGAPIASDDHADKALGAARQMLDRLEGFNDWLRSEGLGDGFKMGIGLNTGDVMSGNVGSARRLEYTTIGDTTNSAARLEGMTKGTPYQLFVADSTRSRLASAPDDLESLDELEVRGRKGAMKVWALRPSRYRSRGSARRRAQPRLFVSIDHAGGFQIVAEEAHEDSAELLFMPEATASDWATIFTYAQVREVSAGLALVQAGEDDRALYLLIDGTLAVRMPREETAFKTIDAPSVVGELAFFDGAPRSATLDALTDVQVVRIDLDCFNELSEAEPELASAMLMDLARILALRLRMASDVIERLRG